MVIKNQEQSGMLNLSNEKKINTMRQRLFLKAGPFICLVLIIGLVFYPTTSSGQTQAQVDANAATQEQTGGGGSGGGLVQVGVVNGKPVYAAAGGNGQTKNGANSTTGAATSLGTCLAQIIVQGLVRSGPGSAGGVAAAVTAVKTTSAADQAQAGFMIAGKPISVGWDAVQVCFVNSFITYIADATIAWINSGFKGNPAFIQNPSQFFKNILDNEAGSFINGIVQGTLGFNLCKPITAQVGLNLASQYGGKGGNGMSCSLSKIMQTQQGYNAFTSGSRSVANMSNLYTVSQSPQNTQSGLFLKTSDQIGFNSLNKQNQVKQETLANKGFLSFKVCDDDKTVTGSDGKTTIVKGACKTKTPGSYIADAATKNGWSLLDRTVFATKFDQVVTALVAQLIKQTLSKGFGK